MRDQLAAHVEDQEIGHEKPMTKVHAQVITANLIIAR